METTNRTLCKLHIVDGGIALAYLTSQEIDLVTKDIAGEINCELPITLITGEVIDAGIIDSFVASKRNPFLLYSECYQKGEDAS